MIAKKVSDFPVTAPSANPVYYRTYSRFENGIRESWADTCARVVDGIAELGKFTDEEKALVYRNVRSQKCLPSGRWLWIGGTEWSKKPQNFYGSYNCLTGETLVSTLEYGAVEISFLEGKTVNVINRNGEWSKAEFSRFPEDEIYEITLRRGIANGALKTIRATGNHRWFPSSADGNAVSTIELKPKDELKVLTAPKPDDTTNSYRLGVQHGAVFGDGSVQGSKPHERVKYKIRLCNEKKELLPYFEGRKVLYCPSYKGDPLVLVNKDDFINFAPDGNLKQLPTTTDVSYLLGFVRGLFATDGCIGERNGSLTAIVSGTLETGLWLETIIPALGFENGTLRCMYEAGQISNYGTRNKALYSLHIYVHSLTSNDLLRSKHREIFEQNISNAQKPIWRVLDVQKLDTKEPVFCCEEPITHGFSLTGGIETGNCFSAPLNSWSRFALSMNLAMQGCGTGSVVEDKYISQLPTIINKLGVVIIGETGRTSKAERSEDTQVKFDLPSVYIKVGDSRQGWVDSYQTLLELSSNEALPKELIVIVDISDIRPKGEKLNGFGGIANPNKLADLYPRLASILNGAIGRKLNTLECILIADESLKVVVAGNIRRAASIKQGSNTDELFLTAKDNLWQQNESGQWVIDPKRDALRMSNHTRLFHHKPSKQECVDSVRKQFYSGEGAIGWMGEAVARCNVDLLETENERLYFLSAYNHSVDYARDYLLNLMLKKQVKFSYQELEHRINRYGANPCYEVVGNSFMCNLSEVHLNQIDPLDFEAQKDAFKCGGLWVAPLLTHKFEDKELQYSRELDPIVGVGLTGLFDFFVNTFGIDWLNWWQAGRPEIWQGDNLEYHKIKQIIVHFNCSEAFIDKELDSTIYKLVEKLYLEFWSEVAHNTVWEYCDRHNLKRPNRCTVVKPSGSQSLLTGASPGWHPPKVEKGGYFLRRITYAKNDPVALACIEYGFNVIPGQSDKDENGLLLNDPYDSRCTEWLVEIPSKVQWADLEGVEDINVSKFSALAQFDFVMQVQKYYVKHNASSTIELTEAEIEPLGERIYQAIQNDEGYISAALLARFESRECYPRLPFTTLSKEQYEQLQKEVIARRKVGNFHDALTKHDKGLDMEVILVACDSGTCEIRAQDAS
jgi:ribonucleotide reductase class II